jgi:hypothetical protein
VSQLLKVVRLKVTASVLLASPFAVKDNCSSRKDAINPAQPRLARRPLEIVAESEHPDASWPCAAFRAQLAKRVEGGDNDVRNESCFKVSGVFLQASDGLILNLWTSMKTFRIAKQ